MPLRARGCFRVRRSDDPAHRRPLPSAAPGTCRSLSRGCLNKGRRAAWARSPCRVEQAVRDRWLGTKWTLEPNKAPESWSRPLTVRQGRRISWPLGSAAAPGQGTRWLLAVLTPSLHGDSRCGEEEQGHARAPHCCWKCPLLCAPYTAWHPPTCAPPAAAGRRAPRPPKAPPR